MKVIKEGKKIVGVVMRVICQKCEAELEIEARDLKKEPCDRPIDPSVFSYKCPCCHRTQYIDWGDLSEEMIFDMQRN